VKKIGNDIKRMLSAFAHNNAAEHLSISDKLKQLKMNNYKQALQSKQSNSHHVNAHPESLEIPLSQYSEE